MCFFVSNTTYVHKGMQKNTNDRIWMKEKCLMKNKRGEILLLEKRSNQHVYTNDALLHHQLSFPIKRMPSIVKNEEYITYNLMLTLIINPSGRCRFFAGFITHGVNPFFIFKSNNRLKRMKINEGDEIL